MAPHDDLTIEERLARLADASLPEPERESLLRAVADCPSSPPGWPSRSAPSDWCGASTSRLRLDSRPPSQRAALRAPSVAGGSSRRERVAVTAGLLAVIFALALPADRPMC